MVGIYRVEVRWRDSRPVPPGSSTLHSSGSKRRLGKSTPRRGLRVFRFRVEALKAFLGFRAQSSKSVLVRAPSGSEKGCCKGCCKGFIGSLSRFHGVYIRFSGLCGAGLGILSLREFRDLSLGLRGEFSESRISNFRVLGWGCRALSVEVFVRSGVKGV